MLYILKIAISLLPVFLFFGYYYRNFVFQKSYLLLSRSLFIGVLSSTVAILIQLVLPPTHLPALKAFVYAALVEETLRFVIIYIRIVRDPDHFTVVDGIFDSILIGLGFAFAENLHYALNHSGYIILLRSISSVPMHAFASGIMGYYLSYHHLCANPTEPEAIAWRRLRIAAAGFLGPWLFHGLFDYFLFLGGVWNYLMPLVLLLGFGTLEYCIARARSIPGKNILEMIGIDADDRDVLDRQTDYEKWIDAAQDEQAEPLSLFKNEWSLFTSVASAVLALPALFLFAVSFVRPEFLHSGPGVDREALVSLLIVLPLSLALILIFSEKINYLYLREYLIRLPGGGKVTIRDRDREEAFLVLDILPRGVFLSDAEDLPVNTELEAEFYRPSGKAVRMRGRVVWSNRSDRKLPIGAIFRFDRHSLVFSIFRLVYLFHKLKNRVRYNLRGLFGTRRPGSRRSG